MAVKKIAVPDLGTLHLYKRRGAKGMRLSVTNQGIIRVSLPHWLPFKTGVDFARKKEQWIKQQQFTPVVLRHGHRIGKSNRLVFFAETERKTTSTRITSEGDIRIYHPAHLRHSDNSVQSAAEKASIRALKAQAESLLPGRIKYLADQHGFTYESVSIKQLKSRWGSCTNQKNIALSCFLMQLPWHLIDYVLLHELVHTRIMAHGPKFWDELSLYVPDLKANRKTIKQHRPVITPQ